MMKTLKQNLQRVAASLLVFTVAGCGPLISFGGDDLAGETYSLRYSSEYTNYSPDAPIIYLSNPQMLEGLDGHSIAVMMPNGQRTVLDGVSWSTHISDLIRDYVGHAIGSQAGVNMIAEGGLDIKAGCRLGVKVWSFELATGASAAEDTVEIALQFSLVRVKDSTLISRPTFTQSVPVPSAGLGGVVEGFKTAMSAAADEYGPWMRERMSQCKG